MKSAAPIETSWIVEQARSLGFDLCGVAPATQFPELAKTQEWLSRGYAGEMKYLEDPRRTQLAAAMPGVQSIIVCALNYNSSFPYSTQVLPKHTGNPPRGWISRYAWGDDYHEVLWEKLNALVERLRQHSTETFEARAYADTGPIHERLAAKYAGLGWIGKNTLLLNQQWGSWFFLGCILTTLDLQPSIAHDALPSPDRCGTCRKCIDACPTQALPEPYVLDARRCISYLTIELRGAIPEQFREGIGQHIFGCDICQDVCPWNRKSPRTSNTHFAPRKLSSTEMEDSLYWPELERLASLSEKEFRAAFRGSPIKRTKWKGFVRNTCIAIGNSGLSPRSETGIRILGVLKRLASSEDAVIAESAQWALSRIK